MKIIEWFREKERILGKKKYKRPFSEWRIPVMIVSVSSVFFVLLTALFGIEINRNTGEMIYNFEGIRNIPLDPWLNPMMQFPEWCYFAMIIGYYIAVVMLIVLWFDYCKWKWENIPIEIRYEIKGKGKTENRMNVRK